MFESITFLICTFLLTPACVATWFEKEKHIFLIAFGISPAIVALFVNRLFYVMPGKSDLVYLLIIFFVQLIFVLYSFYVFGSRVFGCFKNSSFRVFLGSLTILSFVALGFPVYQNDALEYISIANIIYREKSFYVYPFTVEDPVTGFFSPSRHPLGYMNLLVMGKLVSPYIYTTAKLISAYYLSILYVSLHEFFNRKAILYMLSAPILIHLFLYFQLDIYRLSLLVLSLYTISSYFENPSSKVKIILCGIVVGLSLDSHALGLLSVILLGSGVFFVPPAHWVGLVLCGFVALTVGGEIYLRNIYSIGKIVTDENVVWNLPKINESLDLSVRRNISTTFNWLFLGLFQGFTKIHFFGLHFYKLVASFFVRQKAATDYTYKIALFGIVVFSVILLLAGDLGVKNPRYYLTLLPLAMFVYSARLPKNLYIVVFLEILLVFYSLSYLKNWSMDNFQEKTINYKAPHFFLEMARQPITEPVLSFEQSMMVNYSGKKIIRDLNPELVSFYKAKNEAEAIKILKDLDVQYIYLSEFMPATFYNSYAMEITGDPALSKLVFSEGSYRLFKLKDDHEPIEKKIPVDYKFEMVEEKNQLKSFVWGETKYVHMHCLGVEKGDMLQLVALLEGEGTFDLLINGEPYARSVITRHKKMMIQFEATSSDLRISLVLKGKLSPEVKILKFSR